MSLIDSVLDAEREHAEAELRRRERWLARVFLTVLLACAVVGGFLAWMAWDLGSYDDTDRWRIENGEWVLDSEHDGE